MASNSFGSCVRITTWGESHGKGIGCVIDGFPSNIELSEEWINLKLQRRVPGKNRYMSPRKEQDRAEILSGIFEGKTTGAPIAVWIENSSSDSRPYVDTKHLIRPGHAHFTYQHKYGHWDYRGGGRASARETAARVAAGACVERWIGSFGIKATAWLSQVGSITLSRDWENERDIAEKREESAAGIFCPDDEKERQICSLLDQAIEEGDSFGGVVTCRIDGVPRGLGEPIYTKIESCLAHAMMGIPASKGFEIGEGFHAASMKGSSYIDGFTAHSGIIQCASNRAGGMLAGISTGEPIVIRVAFKPTSSIRKPLSTVDIDGNEREYCTPSLGKHDPCVAIRAVPVVEAMAYLVIADLFAHSFSFKREWL